METYPFYRETDARKCKEETLPPAPQSTSPIEISKVKEGCGRSLFLPKHPTLYSQTLRAPFYLLESQDAASTPSIPRACPLLASMWETRLCLKLNLESNIKMCNFQSRLYYSKQRGKR